MSIDIQIHSNLRATTQRQLKTNPSMIGVEKPPKKHFYCTLVVVCVFAAQHFTFLILGKTCLSFFIFFRKSNSSCYVVVVAFLIYLFIQSKRRANKRSARSLFELLLCCPPLCSSSKLRGGVGARQGDDERAVDEMTQG